MTNARIQEEEPAAEAKEETTEEATEEEAQPEAAEKEEETAEPEEGEEEEEEEEEEDEEEIVDPKETLEEGSLSFPRSRRSRTLIAKKRIRHHICDDELCAHTIDFFWARRCTPVCLHGPMAC